MTLYLDVWDKVIKKVVNIKVKANLQPPSRTKIIDSTCLRGYRLLVKKDKDNAN